MNPSVSLFLSLTGSPVTQAGLELLIACMYLVYALLGIEPRVWGTQE